MIKYYFVQVLYRFGVFNRLFNMCSLQYENSKKLKYYSDYKYWCRQPLATLCQSLTAKYVSYTKYHKYLMKTGFSAIGKFSNKSNALTAVFCRVKSAKSFRICPNKLLIDSVLQPSTNTTHTQRTCSLCVVRYSN